MTDPRIEEMAVYAWIGEDESSELGIKVLTIETLPSGQLLLAPLVAVHAARMRHPRIRQQIEDTATAMGKPMRLVRFKFARVVEEVLP
jgi:hypothetical protein